MIVFHDDITKGIDVPSVALLKLRMYLDTNEPKLVYWLQNLWNNQQRAITYKELREAILSGVLSQEMLDAWHQDYSIFVTEHVAPMWAEALKEAVKELEERYPAFSLDLMGKGVMQWTRRSAASFVTNVTSEQKAAIRAVVRRASRMQDMNVDELSRAIRPMVGLNQRQAQANLNLYTRMRKDGVTHEKAMERSVRYSARQSRYRGYMIARTELAHAYNHGEYIGVQDAMNQGMMGHTVKVWCTADDERVCDICGDLDGTEFDMDQDITYKGKNNKYVRINPKLRVKDIGKTPPAHPHCRCSLLYQELEPPAADPAGGSTETINVVGPEGESAGTIEIDF